MKLDHLLTPHRRVSSQLINYLNVSPETIKIIEENIGSKISDIARSNIIRYISPGKGNKRKKINKWDYIKLKSFYVQRKTSTK